MAYVTKTLNGLTATLLTDDDVTGKVSLQNTGPTAIRLIGTTSASTPAADTRGPILLPNSLGLGYLMEDLFPGMSAVRIYAVSLGETGAVDIAYA